MEKFILKKRLKQQINLKRAIHNVVGFKALNRPFKLYKSLYNSVVPLVIYQTWHTKDLPPKMRERTELLRRCNPRFQYHLFDDNDCEQFIRANFEERVVNAYNRLIPGAYKADLWRLCVLYKNGGFYLDIKLACINGFRLIELSEGDHYVKDRPHLCIFNSFMVSCQGNDFLRKGIYKIVENVENKNYGGCPLSPTGPRMLGDIIQRDGLNLNVDCLHYKHGSFIIYKKRFILSTEYPEYNEERTNAYQHMGTKRYDHLWNERAIYRS